MDYFCYRSTRYHEKGGLFSIISLELSLFPGNAPEQSAPMHDFRYIFLPELVSILVDPLA